MSQPHNQGPTAALKRTPEQQAQAEWIDQLRRQYIQFFEDKGHLQRPSAPVKSDDPTLMFTSAGMVQFKPYFLGATPKFEGVDGTHHRVTTTQKCLRINDIENVGRTLRHHSFFEMLGNFSFGDYFKKDASLWAWEFLTDRLGFDPERLYVTVYLNDDQAFDVWKNDVGVPEARISRWGEDENFWPANAVSEGPNGPCGPCSEVFYDRGAAYGREGEDGPNTGSGDRFIEIWNLVFTQFDRQDGGALAPLPQQNIDTGLGFERLVAVLSGSEDAYATELFQPTIREVVRRSGVAYDGVRSTSHRVIADHVRAVAFAILDGVLPANDGAGYVIKMLLRRASRHAWLLGLKDPVLHALVPAVVQAMGRAYPELAGAQERIASIIEAEEKQFLRTLEAGIARTQKLLDDLEGGILPGDVAFDLWETHGFPLDLTRDLAAERGVEVDAEGYAAARERARERSKAGGEGATLFTASSDALGRIAGEHGETAFVGYNTTRTQAKVIALLQDDQEIEVAEVGDRVSVVLDATAFYPEGGGQIGDPGKLVWDGGGAVVRGASKSPQGLVVHDATVERGRLEVGQSVDAQVDPQRLETEKHHSATHLLHAALRSIVGTHVAQAGSLVTPDRLRFDVSHPKALTQNEITQIETLVNRWVQADLPVRADVVPIAEARDAGAMMLFGEKYGNTVRMVRMGGETLGDVSIELCGGTHVARTGHVGAFFITGEEAVSAGVRRITAVAGQAAVRHVHELQGRVRAVAGALNARPEDAPEKAEKLQADLKAARKEAEQLKQKLAEAQTGSGTGAGTFTLDGVGEVHVNLLDGLDGGALRNAADTAQSQTGADVVILASGGSLVVKVSKSAQDTGVHAGKLAKAIAQQAGGGGGGRPDMAQAGVKDAGLLSDVVRALADKAQPLPI
jgi:alanyl-tRNA synthetase